MLPCSGRWYVALQTLVAIALLLSGIVTNFANRASDGLTTPTWIKKVTWKQQLRERHKSYEYVYGYDINALASKNPKHICKCHITKETVVWLPIAQYMYDDKSLNFIIVVSSFAFTNHHSDHILTLQQTTKNMCSPCNKRRWPLWLT